MLPTVTSIGDEKWWDVFQDKELQGLIRTALKNNYDVRIAATRVLQAQAQLGITRADQFPTLTGGGNVSSVRNPTIGPIPAYEITLGEVAASASWNVDFWGRYRRATEAARANLLANEWAQTRSDFHFGRRRREFLFPASPTGSATRNLQKHVGLATGFAEFDQDAGRARNKFSSGRSPIRATRLYRRRGNTRSRAANPAAGKRHQHPAGKQSGANSAWPETHRAAAFSGGSGRASFRFVGAAPGHSRGGRESGRG